MVAVDISEAMLARLSEKEALKGRVEARCQDILTHPLESQVDLTVSMVLYKKKNNIFSFLV